MIYTHTCHILLESTEFALFVFFYIIIKLNKQSYSLLCILKYYITHEILSLARSIHFDGESLCN